MGNTKQFDAIAGSYDTPERIHTAKISADAIRGYLADTKDKDAMDFGCGTGLVGINLLHEFKSMLFVDSSQNMLDVLEQKLAHLKLPNASALYLDLEASERPLIQADYIFMVQVLLHIKDFASVLSALYDMMPFGGHLLIVDFDKNDQVVSEMVHPGFDQEQLKQVLQKIGYQNIHSKTFYSGSRIFMGQDASLFILDAEK